MEAKQRDPPPSSGAGHVPPPPSAGAWPTTLPELPSSSSSLAPRNQLGGSTEEGYLGVG